MPPGNSICKGNIPFQGFVCSILTASPRLLLLRLNCLWFLVSISATIDGFLLQKAQLLWQILSAITITAGRCIATTCTSLLRHTLAWTRKSKHTFVKLVASLSSSVHCSAWIILDRFCLVSSLDIPTFPVSAYCMV